MTQTDNTTHPIDTDTSTTDVVNPSVATDAVNPSVATDDANPPVAVNPSDEVATTMAMDLPEGKELVDLLRLVAKSTVINTVIMDKIDAHENKDNIKEVYDELIKQYESEKATNPLLDLL